MQKKILLIALAAVSTNTFLLYGTKKDDLKKVTKVINQLTHQSRNVTPYISTGTVVATSWDSPTLFRKNKNKSVQNKTDQSRK